MHYEKQTINELTTAQNAELTQKFTAKLEAEPNLKFLEQLFAELPELELYLVGGMVRDTIINHPTSKDYDFIARKVPIQKLIDALSKLGHVIFEGRNFAVLKFWPRNSTLKEPIDIALPRTEKADGTGGYRDVETQADHNLPIGEDLSRRDLTINAIAWDTKNQTLIDPFNGQADLANKLIRSVGRPEERFQEDYSRILRAIRLACRFDFEIEAGTWQAIEKLTPHLNDQRQLLITELIERQIAMCTDDKERKRLEFKLEEQRRKNPDATRLEYIVPRETIAKELLKSLKENPARAADLLQKSGALKLLIPELTAVPTEQLQKIQSPALREFFPGKHLTGEFAMGVLIHQLDEETAKRIAHYIKLPDEFANKLAFIAAHKEQLDAAFAAEKLSINKFAKIFIDSRHSSDLLMLMYLTCASDPEEQQAKAMADFKLVTARIEAIKKIREKLPEKIIHGEDILRILELKTHPLISIVKSVILALADSGSLTTEEEALSILTANKQLFLSYKDKVQDKGINKDDVVEEISAAICPSKN